MEFWTQEEKQCNGAFRTVVAAQSMMCSNIDSVIIDTWF